MNNKGNVMKDKNKELIITEDGLFYSNFDKEIFTTIGDPKGIYDPDRVLLFSLVPEELPKSVLYLRDEYGVKIGKPQPWSNGVISDNQVGVYIVDYEKYLSDMKEGSLGKGRAR